MYSVACVVTLLLMAGCTSSTSLDAGAPLPDAGPDDDSPVDGGPNESPPPYQGVCGFGDCRVVEGGALELCQYDETYNRLADVACAARTPPEPTLEVGAAVDGCRVHADCEDGEFCIERDGDATQATTECVRPCEVDADCAQDEACLCGAIRGFVNECVSATCRTAADCGGLPCGVTDVPCVRRQALRCRQESDTCGGSCFSCVHTCADDASDCPDGGAWVGSNPSACQ